MIIYFPDKYGTFEEYYSCIYSAHLYKYSTLTYYVIRMSPKIEKKLNKLLIGAILWTTILWIGASMTPKGKSFWKRAGEFVKGWVEEIKKLRDKNKKDKQ